MIRRPGAVQSATMTFQMRTTTEKKTENKQNRNGTTAHANKYTKENSNHFANMFMQTAATIGRVDCSECINRIELWHFRLVSNLCESQLRRQCRMWDENQFVFDVKGGESSRMWWCTLIKTRRERILFMSRKTSETETLSDRHCSHLIF